MHCRQNTILNQFSEWVPLVFAGLKISALWPKENLFLLHTFGHLLLHWLSYLLWNSLFLNLCVLLVRYATSACHQCLKTDLFYESWAGTTSLHISFHQCLEKWFSFARAGLPAPQSGYLDRVLHKCFERKSEWSNVLLFQCDWWADIPRRNWREAFSVWCRQRTEVVVFSGHSISQVCWSAWGCWLMTSALETGTREAVG